MQVTQKMKAAVLGVGRMGEAICYAMKSLGFEVIGIDSNKDAVKNFRKHIVGGSTGVFYATDKDKSWRRPLRFEHPDILISSLPYHQTEEVAKWCIDNGTRYCDLGGRVDVSHRINEYAKEKATKPVFTDLGLAPGWVNILAEHGCKQLHRQATTVRMMVGGLPDSKVNRPLDYVVTWSIDGLINEYKDDCEILEAGEIKTVKGMSGLESVECNTLGKLEAFYTSGGASHTIQSMKSKGVTNCYYKTLRYEGHRDIVRFLMKNQSEECVREAFEKGCQNSDGVDDVVLIKAFVEGGDIKWKNELAIWGDSDGFSAMQKATAFSISSVAKIMAEGKLEGNKEEHRSYHTQHPVNLSYADVPFDEFNNNLKLLKII